SGKGRALTRRRSESSAGFLTCAAAKNGTNAAAMIIRAAFFKWGSPFSTSLQCNDSPALWSQVGQAFGLPDFLPLLALLDDKAAALNCGAGNLARSRLFRRLFHNGGAGIQPAAPAETRLRPGSHAPIPQ